MAEFQQRGDDLENNFAECKRMLEEAEGHLKQLEAAGGGGEEDEERDAEQKKVQAVAEKLREDLKSFERLMTEYRQEEQKLPWNVDTLSKEGFSKARLQLWCVSKCEAGLHLLLLFPSRVFSTSRLLQTRKLRRKRWRNTRPLWRSMQRKSSTLVSFCTGVMEYSQNYQLKSGFQPAPVLGS